MNAKPQPGAPPPASTVAGLIRDAARAHADREAFRSFGVALAYRDLLARAGEATSWLQQAGLAKGERVALMMPNLLPYPTCLYGALLGGYAVVGVNPLYTARELAHQLRDSEARALFVLEPFAHVAAEALKEAPVPNVVVVRTGDMLGLKGRAIDFVARHVKRAVKPWRIPGHVRFADALGAGRARPAAPVDVGADDVAFLAYTGGTTGVSKAAVILHRNVIAHTSQVAELVDRVLGGSPEDARALTALPLYHAAALMGQAMILPRQGGCAILVANPRDLDGLIATMREERFTVLAGVNTLFLALLEHPKIGTVDFSRCRFFNAAAMATQKTVSDRWQALTGRPLVEGYGLSEATALVTCNPVDATSFSGDVGFPTTGTELSIRDDAGNALPPGAHGEICVRGPQVMAGYWKRPDETAKVMTADGFLRTGDIGSLDARGRLTLHERKKDMVVVSGFNVYPNEVEAVIAAHPQVVEACVVGIPDAHSGEAVAASVVRRDPALTEESLLAHCRAGLAAYKCPKRIEFAEALPKSPVGKILRRAVRERWAAAVPAPGA